MGGLDEPLFDPISHAEPYAPIVVQESEPAATSDRPVSLDPGPPPGSFDLRNVGGTNYVTPVKDQANLGTW
jgi:hypothetical protein